jgi:hypothetical protein
MRPGTESRAGPVGRNAPGANGEKEKKMEFILKIGKITKDPRLDRIVQFDERSRNFMIREIVAEKKARSYTWRCTTCLDQGNEGSCVGHGVGHELLARPAEASPRTVTHRYAREVIYWGAQKIDGWPGGAYPGARPFYEGTSVLAGVKEAQALGWMESYRWGFSLEDLVLGVGYNGPAVLGISWLQGMMDTDAKGYIHPSGQEMGGHCILCRAVSISYERFTLRNSWGKSWGMGGDCYVSFDDMRGLLKMDGESCFFIHRKTKV